MRTALMAVSTVWILGCVWSYQEQSAFAASKGFTFPHLLPLVIDGFAVSMAGVAWAASLDARPAIPARLATIVAVAASSASNGAWAYLRAHHDLTTVVLGVTVPIAANLAFEVLLAELRRQVQRRRGLPPPVAIPYPRLIRIALAPFNTFKTWRTLVLELTALEHTVTTTAPHHRPEPGIPTTATAVAQVAPAAPRAAASAPAAAVARRADTALPAGHTPEPAAHPAYAKTPAETTAAPAPADHRDAPTAYPDRHMPAEPAQWRPQPTSTGNGTPAAAPRYAEPHPPVERPRAAARPAAPQQPEPRYTEPQRPEPQRPEPQRIAPPQAPPAAPRQPAATQRTVAAPRAAAAPNPPSAPPRPEPVAEPRRIPVHQAPASSGDNSAHADTDADTDSGSGRDRRPIDPRVVQLAQHLASTEDADEITGEMVGPLLKIDVAPRTGRRLLGQARELVNQRARAEADGLEDSELSVIGGR
jgi:hypothetical protein